MFIDLMPYTGIPYVDKGRDPKTGLDCWGLVRWFYQREKQIDLPSYTEQASGTDPRVGPLVLAEISRSWKPVSTPLSGDVVVIRVSKRPFHVGIYVGRGRMLHSLNQAQGSVIESLNSPKWANRVEGYYRHV